MDIGDYKNKKEERGESHENQPLDSMEGFRDFSNEHCSLF